MGEKTKKAMTINGQYLEDLIEGYNTLDVSGRESHSGSIKSIEKFSDGNEWLSRRYGGRTLTVSFVIQEGTNLELRRKLEHLAGLIDVKNAKVIFDDEPDKYFNAYLGENLNFGVMLGIATGSFDLYCADPFKYDVEETQASVTTKTIYEDGTTKSAAMFIVNNDGYKTFPRFVVDFDRDDGYMMFAKTNNLNFWNGSYAQVVAGNEYLFDGSFNGIYFSTSLSGEKISLDVLNDPQFRHVIGDDGNQYDVYIADKTGYITADDPQDMTVTFANPKTSSIYFGNQKEEDTTIPELNKDFAEDKNYTGWAVDSTITMVNDTFVNSPNATVAADANGVKGNDYKTITTLGFCGPVLVHQLQYNQPGDFTLNWYQKFICDKKQAGCFQIMLLDTNKEPVICCSISNNNTKNQNGTVELFYKKEVRSWDLTTTPLTAGGAYGTTTTTKTEKVNGKNKTTKTTLPTKNRNYISRKDNVIEICLAADTTKVLTIEEETKSSIRYVALYFGKYNNSSTKSSALKVAGSNSVLAMDFTSAAVDVDNVFSKDDRLIVDCTDMSVYINGLSRPDIGDIGNDWLDMCLETGVNYISCEWSDWSEISPDKLKMLYRKRYI